jgi:hypothetical protein
MLLNKGIVNFDRFERTVHVELDFSFESYESPMPEDLELWIRNYWFLRKNLHVPHLQTLSVTFPDSFAIPELDSDRLSCSAEETLVDMQDFVRELADKCQRLHVSYLPGNYREDDPVSPDDIIPLFSHVWKLGDIISDLKFYVSAYIDDVPDFGAMRGLKTLELQSQEHFYGRPKHYGRWIDLRRCPIETLRLRCIPFPHQIHLPRTITNLSINYLTHVTWALRVGFCLPHLQHLVLSTTSELEDPWDDDDFEDFTREEIVSIKLQTLQIMDCVLPSIYLKWISETCTKLSSLQFELPGRGSKLIKHLSAGITNSCLERSTDEYYTLFEKDDYWRAFFRGLPLDQVHVLFHAGKGCTCFTRTWRFPVCRCDTMAWKLDEISRGKAASLSRSAGEVVIMQYHDSRILMQTVEEATGEVIIQRGDGHNIMVYPVNQEISEMASAQEENWGGRLRYWKFSNEGNIR